MGLWCVIIRVSAMAKVLKIAVGSDHGGFDLKDQLLSYLNSCGHTVIDCGTHNRDAVDYPRIAFAVASKVSDHEADFGIIIDGAGIGSAMTAGKVRGVRPAACYNEALAKNAREHNDANVLTLGAGQTSLGLARRIVEIFLTTNCTEERHQRRVQMIKDAESGPLQPLPAPTAEAASGLTGKPSIQPSATTSEAAVQDLSTDDIQRITHRVRQIMAAEGVSGDISLHLKLEPKQIAQMIDHTVLKAETSQAEVDRVCDEAIKYKFFSVCVNSTYTRQVANKLRGTGVKTCTVVGFPLGAMPPDIKAAEARKAIREGADEIDMVINVGALKSGQNELVLKDIRAVVEACRDGRRALLKVILETSLLTDAEKTTACQLCLQAGVDFVKTSTGFSTGGATPQDVSLMASIVSHRGVKVKASGGVRNYSDAIRMIEAGASRLGCSSSVAIIEEATAVAEGRPYTPKKKAKGDY